LPPWWNFCY